MKSLGKMKREYFRKVRPGQTFVASPLLKKNQLFDRGVLYVLETSDDAVKGMLLNKPIWMTLGHALGDEEMVPWEFDLFFGGPADSTDIRFIHRAADIGGTSISDGFYIGGEIEDLVEAIRIGRIDKGDVKFVAGYCNFDRDEFEMDVDDKMWLLSKVSDPVGAPQWTSLIERLGANFRILSGINYQNN